MKKAKKRQFVIDVGITVAVGQMAQTIYIPAIADMARDLNVREGRCRAYGRLSADLRCLAAVLWPDIRPRGSPTSDPRRNVHFYAGNAGRGHDLQFDGIDCRQRDAGMGTGVGGVMARTLPRFI